MTLENNPTDLQKFKKRVIDQFAEKMTDYVFLMIQNDKELMSEYLHVIQDHTSLKVINSQIAQEIGKKFNLKSTSENELYPRSVLIQSYEKFSINE